MSAVQKTDVAIIGAGPAGSLAASCLHQLGWQVTVLERSHFPRFSIGESLLPQCMTWLESAGMMPALQAAGFQHKGGAAFVHGERYGELDYAKNYSPGWTSTWEVERAKFDQIMAQEAVRQGADIRFGQSVKSVDLSRAGEPRLSVAPADGDTYELQARFLCDASGFGRVLPRLLGLEKPSAQPTRAAIFTHVADHIAATADHDREKILLSYHPEHNDIWYWLIPFSGGRASIGVTGSPEAIGAQHADPLAAIRELIAQEPRLASLLDNAVFDSPVRAMTGFAVAVSRLYGQDFALLGNAGEFVDPVFSSGVTVAMKSATLAAPLIDRQLRGQAVDWQTDFAAPLRAGSRVFEAFVNAWYDGSLKHVFFKTDPDPEIKRMLSSILAGYVWDQSNPYVAKPKRRLRALCETCAQ